MEIEKIWINRNSTDHNFILFNDNTIYRRQVKVEHFSTVEREVKKGIISTKFFGLPLRYIKYIALKDSGNSLKIIYGKESEDEIIISDDKLRQTIFNYLKDTTKIKGYYKQCPSILSRIKKPLIALGVITGIFIYVYSIIAGIEEGYVYKASGARFGGIALALAQLGLTKNLLLFCPLASIAIFRIWFNYDEEVHYLYY